MITASLHSRTSCPISSEGICLFADSFSSGIPSSGGISRILKRTRFRQGIMSNSGGQVTHFDKTVTKRNDSDEMSDLSPREEGRPYDDDHWNFGKFKKGFVQCGPPARGSRSGIAQLESGGCVDPG